jgi:hypothetical protein
VGMGIVLIPPAYRRFTAPTIFLAGPIQGARDWQHDAIGMIHGEDENLVIANPRRGAKGEFTPGMYDEQVDWETHYLRQAAAHGTIMFWMAKEHEHLCRRAYAQTTRFEFSEWATWYKLVGKQLGKILAVGIEDGYTGAKYIRRRMSQDCPALPIHDSLQATCRYAVAAAHLRYGKALPPQELEFSLDDHWLRKPSYF